MTTSESFLYRQKEGYTRPKKKDDAERAGLVAQWYNNETLLWELKQSNKVFCFYKNDDYPYHTYYAIQAKDILPLLHDEDEWAQCHLKVDEAAVALCQPEEWLFIAWKDES
jgi:hypothetical protein